MITTEDVLTSCGKFPARTDWVSPAVQRNATDLATRVTALLVRFGASRKLSSGFRDPETNKRTSGAAAYSRHMYGQAADIEDNDGTLKAWAAKNAAVFEEVGLWCEPLSMTPAWLHVQTVPNPQGVRVPR